MSASTKNRNIHVAAGILSPLLHKFRLQFTADSYLSTIEILISDKYSDLEPHHRRLVIRALSVLEMDSVVAALRGDRTTQKGRKYACAILQTAIVSPCMMVQCRFQIPVKSSLNCLLVHSEENAMTAEDIALVLQCSTEQVNETYLLALRKMRENSIPVAQGHAAELPKQFTFLSNSMVCGNCERQIVGTPFYIEDKVAFCSPECCDNRSPILSVLESRYGVPAEHMIHWAITSFKTIDSAAQALAVPVSVLTDVVKQNKHLTQPNSPRKETQPC